MATKYMYTCPECGNKNWDCNVPLGICGWCGYNGNKDDSFIDQKNQQL